ncbi:MAG: CBS domain-containing protein [Gemmataceae bacterium]
MSTVQALLDAKGHKVMTTDRGIPVLDVVKQMVAANISAVMITDAKGRLVGIFTERDVSRRVVAEELDPASTPVGEVMTEGVAYGTPQMTIEEARALMVNGRLRHLPIQDEEYKLVGIISMTDLNAHEVGRVEDVITTPRPTGTKI